MKSTLQEINGIIKATETARTKLKIERDRTAFKLKDIEAEKVKLEGIAYAEVCSEKNAKKYSNDTKRKIAVKEMLSADLSYLDLQGKEDRIELEIKEIGYKLRDNLTELNFQKREYEINKWAWQAEISERG